MLKWSEFVFVLIIGICFAQQTNFIQIDPNSRFFVDQFSRVRLFHGVNAVFKVPPWHPTTDSFNSLFSLCTKDMDDLAIEWGFNVVRLGMMWPGVVPASNNFNSTYLDVMEKIINGLGERGIYTILDCHQDVFSRFFCGEGVPDWAVPLNVTESFPRPRHLTEFEYNSTTDYPELKDCHQYNFFSYYYSAAVSEAFEALYKNYQSLQDEFIFYWQTVAERFKSNQFVLGYELINEPWAGDYLNDIRLLIEPGYADKQNLVPLYTALNSAIRPIDNNHIIFFEPTVSDKTVSGFDEGPGGPNYNNRQAYSYHIYCGSANSSGDPVHPKECAAINEYLFDCRMHDSKRMGVGSMMTEFGALLGTESGVKDLDQITGLADKHIQSWTYWQFKWYADITTQSSSGGESFYLPDGSLDEPKIKALSRTYARAIAGTPSLHDFNPNTSQFELEYEINPAANNNTEIWLNEQFYYPNGYDVAISPYDMATWKPISRNRIEILHSPGATGQLNIIITQQQTK